MTWRERSLRGLAAQLRRPSGLRGRLVARGLNRNNRAMIRAAIDLAAPIAGQTVADLGFGGGVGLRLLLDRVGPYGRVRGVDLSTDMVRRAERQLIDPITLGRLTVTVGPLERLPLPDAVIDVAITVNTIYFVTDLDVIARELRRITAAGGRVVVAIGDPDAMATMPLAPYGFTIRTVNDVQHSLERAGWEAVEVRSGGAGPGRYFLFAAGSEPRT
jgi:arsenite methyltransferase